MQSPTCIETSVAPYNTRTFIHGVLTENFRSMKFDPLSKMQTIVGRE